MDFLGKLRVAKVAIEIAVSTICRMFKREDSDSEDATMRESELT